MVNARHLVVLLLLSLMGGALAEPQVRVLLSEQPGELTITMPGAHRGYMDGLLHFVTPFGLTWPLTAQEGKLWTDGQAIGHSLTLQPDDGAFVSWQGRSYRGALELVAEGDTIRVINVVGLEDYLRGVLPAEMQASWPFEALKAQAVASRTYTLASLDPEADYDVCATPYCQVYEGVAAEHPRSDAAIAATQGVVLVYRGDLAQTFYHADSGGHLASSAEVWGRALPYLIAQSDVGGRSPHRQWVHWLEPDVMAASLAAHGIDLGAVRALRVLRYSESGRVLRVEVVGEHGRTELSGTTLRTLLRGWGLKSTRFRMTSELVAQGNGWGHGVGMSQYGARSLALTGSSFKQILAFYYPGTSLQTIFEQRLVRR